IAESLACRERNCPGTLGCGDKCVIEIKQTIGAAEALIGVFRLWLSPIVFRGLQNACNWHLTEKACRQMQGQPSCSFGRCCWRTLPSMQSRRDTCSKLLPMILAIQGQRSI